MRIYIDASNGKKLEFVLNAITDLWARPDENFASMRRNKEKHVFELSYAFDRHAIDVITWIRRVRTESWHEMNSLFGGYERYHQCRREESKISD